MNKEQLQIKLKLEYEALHQNRREFESIHSRINDLMLQMSKLETGDNK